MTSDPNDGNALRVASLLPAATEIVCALGHGASLVGISHECDYPPEVVGLSVLTRSKLARAGSSAAIERDVRSILQAALAVYDVDLAALRAARPDVIVTQDLCDVCAVSLDDVRRAAAEVAPGARIVSLSPLRLDDIWGDLRRVGEALGSSARAEELVDELRARMLEVSRRAARPMKQPNVLTVEWLDPVMVGGTWMPELVELVHGRPLVTRPGDRAPTLSVEALQALDPAPDVVVLKPCGFTLARSEMEIERIDRLIESMPWPAALCGDVFLADGHAYFNRPGPRIVESLEILAACVHPWEFQDFAEKHAASYVRVAAHGRKPLAHPRA